MNLFTTKPKHKVVFFENYNGSYKKIGMKTIKGDDYDEFSFRGRRYFIELRYPIYIDNSGAYYYFDYSNGQMFINGTINFTTETITIDGMEIIKPKVHLKSFRREPLFAKQSEELNKLADKHMVSELLRASKQKMNWKELLPYLIGFIGLGMFFGYLLNAIATANAWW